MSKLNSGGKYDALYSRTDLLWSDTPGRVLRWLLARQPAIKNALDIGCGDGKNTICLATAGATVSAFDVSGIALEGLKQRMTGHPEEVIQRISAHRADCCTAILDPERWDCVVFYGVAHCLDNDCLAFAMEQIWSSLKFGGWLCFCSLNNDLPMPDHHGTDSLIMRSHEEILIYMRGFEVVQSERGKISETHPGVSLHAHGVTWVMARKYE